MNTSHSSQGNAPNGLERVSFKGKKQGQAGWGSSSGIQWGLWTLSPGQRALHPLPPSAEFPFAPLSWTPQDAAPICSHDYSIWWKVQSAGTAWHMENKMIALYDGPRGCSSIGTALKLNNKGTADILSQGWVASWVLPHHVSDSWSIISVDYRFLVSLSKTKQKQKSETRRENEPTFPRSSTEDNFTRCLLHKLQKKFFSGQDRPSKCPIFFDPWP